MPLETQTFSGPISEANYLMGRLLSGCDALKEAGGHESYEACWINGVEFGEWKPDIDAMPKAVVVNGTYTVRNNGEDSGQYIPTGQIACLLYLKTDDSLGTESEKETAALNYFGDLIGQIFEQSGNLNNPGTQHRTKTRCMNEILLQGPTRTSERDRGPNCENDYFDAVLIVDWGQQQ